jgi:hypothetical protein
MDESAKSDATRPASDDVNQTFAHEDELREEQDHESLGGCDLEHCQRMRG